MSKIIEISDSSDDVPKLRKEEREKAEKLYKDIIDIDYNSDNNEEESGDQQDFEVEEIIDHREIDNNVEYYVHWLGYPDSENTWEKQESLNNCQFLIAKYWENIKSKETKQKPKNTQTKQKEQKKKEETKPKENTNKQKSNKANAQTTKNTKKLDNSTKMEILYPCSYNGKIIFACWRNNNKVFITNERMKKAYPKELLKYYESVMVFENETH